MPNANLLLTHYVKVEHYTPDSGNANQEGYVLDLGLQAIACNIQPASPYVTALNNGAYGKGYTIFAPVTASGVLETDRLTTVSGTYAKTFIVKGRQLFNYAIGQHLELYVEEPQG